MTEKKLEKESNLEKVEMNEQNIRLLLQMVLSIMTDEQIARLNQMLGRLEGEQKSKLSNPINPQNSLRSYIGFKLIN